jgi:hypothetical protein
MLDTEREEQLLQVLLLLKEESQRLVRRHKEIQEEFDCVVHELYVLRRKRRVREGREIFSRLDNVALLMPRSAGGATRRSITQIFLHRKPQAKLRRIADVD